MSRIAKPGKDKKLTKSRTAGDLPGWVFVPFKFRAARNLTRLPGLHGVSHA